MTSDRKVNMMLERCELVAEELEDAGFTDERLAEIVLPSVAMLLKDLEAALNESKGA